MNTLDASEFSSRTGAEAKEYHYAKSATQGCKN